MGRALVSAAILYLVFLLFFLMLLPAGNQKRDAMVEKPQEVGEGAALTAVSPAPSIELGKKIFAVECEPCHGPGGTKSMPGMKKEAANLASEYVQKKTDAELKKVIREGKKENPEMAGHPWLSNDEVGALVLFIRSLKK
ncbi:MAG: cytochrome c [Candidatus Sungbacteria bacterium]|nr:cytochrome c [Candidatus Sungbacteria bacterium]